MKRVSILSVLVLSVAIIFSGCGKAKVEQTQNNAEVKKVDEKQVIKSNIETFFSSMYVEGKAQGLLVQEDDNYLYYSTKNAIYKMNKKTGLKEIVTDSNLDNITKLFYKNNALYYINNSLYSRDYKVYKYDLLNKKASVIKEFSNISFCDIDISDNYLVCYISGLQEELDKFSVIYSISLNNLACSEIYRLETYSSKNYEFGSAHEISKFKVLDNNLYYIVYTNAQSKRSYNLYKYDFNTSKSKEIYKSEGHIGYFYFLKHNNELLFNVQLSDSSSENNAIILNESTGNATTKAKIEIPVNIKTVLSNNKIYFINSKDKNRLYSIDLDGTNFTSLDPEGSDITRLEIYELKDSIVLASVQAQKPGVITELINKNNLK